MKKIFFITVFYVFITNLIWSTPATNLEEAKNATVYLVQYNVKNEPVSYGTGFFINDYGTIVTNFHVIQPFFKIRIWLYDLNTKTYSEQKELIIDFDEIAILNYDKKIEKPILRQNLMDYLSEVEHNILYESDTGIMSIISNMETNVVGSLNIKEVR